MRLNSYFSWNSATLPCRRSLEKPRVSRKRSSSVTRPSMRVRLMTSSPTVFIMRSRRDKRNAHGFRSGCRGVFFLPALRYGAAAQSARASDSMGAPFAATSAVTGASSASIGATSAMRLSRESTPVRISASSAHCLCRVFFRTSTDSRQRSMTCGSGSISPSRKPADQIFDAMSDGAKSLEADLRGGTLYRVNGAEKFVDLFRTVIALRAKAGNR